VELEKPLGEQEKYFGDEEKDKMEGEKKKMEEEKEKMELGKYFSEVHFLLVDLGKVFFFSQLVLFLSILTN